MSCVPHRVLLVGMMATGLLGAGCVSACAPAWARSLDHGLMSAKAVSDPEEGERRKHQEVYKITNFLLLVGGLAFLLRKPLAQFFMDRSASIRKSLEEGRKALEASQAQLRAVEEKLGLLEEEIRAFKDAAAREMEAERQRLRQSTAEEAEKILQSARAQIETATRAAMFELKNYAAQEALKLGEDLIRERLDDSSRRRLVTRFVDQLTVNS